MPPGALNLQQSRVVDPVLSTVARGYRNAVRAWPDLFPPVEVLARGGKMIEFNPDDFTKIETIRAPGAVIPRAEFGYAGKDYNCVQRALSGVVPRERVEEAAAVPGINMQSITVQKTMNVLDLQIEVAAAKLATTASNYASGHTLALSSNKRWDDNASTPNKAVANAIQKIRQGIGQQPNVLVLGYPVYNALQHHEDVIDRIKYTESLREGGEPIINAEKLASYFGVEKVIVGAAMTGEAGDFTDAWGKHAILAYSDVTPLANMGSPSFGYTYRLSGYPMVEPGWFDENSKSWVYSVTTEDTPALVGNAAGFLWTTVVT